MVEAEVLPAAARRGALAPRPSASLFVAGRGEGDVAEALGDLGRAERVAVGSYPHDGEIELRFTGSAPDAASRVRAVADEASRRLGADAVGPRPLAETVLAALRERGLRLAVAESMTGGLLASMLTDVPGASDVLAGGWVVYSAASKRDWLDVPAETLAREGAVSDAVARALAEGALRRSGADAALAVTGAAGPAAAPGPAGPVPPGTVHVAASLRGGEVSVDRLVLPGLPRAVVRRRAALAALDRLRRRILRPPG
jgi:nicotinamide-nucleotide amidase